MYSLRIWSAHPDADLPPIPSLSGYTVEAGGWVPAAPEEIPPEIYLSLPGIAARLELRIQPDPEPGIRKHAEKLALAMAQREDGAFEVLTEDGSRTVLAAAPLTFPAMSRMTDRVSLALWFPAGSAQKKRPELVRALGEILPAALPARYGAGNPPEFVRNGDAETGAFLFFLQTCDRPVWFASSPVGNVFLRDKVSEDADGECGFLAVEFSAAVWDAPAWREAMKRLLVRLCGIYSAFFGQIVPGPRPAVGNRFRGIPLELGSVCYFGELYAGKIGGRENGTAVEGGLLFCEPNGPFVDGSMLSVRRKNPVLRLKSRGRGYLTAEDFTVAADLPRECFIRK